MTEEKADQIIRCVKECWWQVLIVLLIGLGLPITLFDSWPELDQATAAWVQALGSIGAIIGAFVISKKTFDDERTLRRESQEKERERIFQGYRAVVLHLAEEARSLVELMKKNDARSLVSAWKVARRATAHACLSAFNSIPIYDLGTPERIKWAFFLKEEVEVLFWNIDSIQLNERSNIVLKQFNEEEVPSFLSRLDDFYEKFEATFTSER